MAANTLCLNCGYRFEGQECPLCCWSVSDTPGKKQDNFRITLVFENENDPEFDKVLDLAGTAFHFASSEEKTGTRYYATYLPAQAGELFRLFEKVESGHRLNVLLNGKLRPYTRNLWLPLLWFLVSEGQSEPGDTRYGN